MRSVPSPGWRRRTRTRSPRSCGSPSEAGAIELGELRAAVERFPRHAALKFILGLRGVPIREDVRRPLRQLSDGEREELRGWLESS